MSYCFTESATTQPTNSGSVVPDPDGEENGSLTQTSPVTDATSATASSSPIGIVATDSETINHSSRTSSLPTVTPSIIGGTSSASQELPGTNDETTEATPEAVGAPNSSSITILASVIGGSVFVLLHIVILAILIYLCYRAKKSGKTSDVANVENASNERDQTSAGHEYMYVRATPHSCTNANSELIEDTDQHIYESSNYTLPIHGSLLVDVDQNPAYGCQDQYEQEDPYTSNSINKGHDEKLMNSYTKILPPTP